MDAHEGLEAAIQRVVGPPGSGAASTLMRNALAHVSKGQHTMVAAAIRQAFIQPDHASATRPWRHADVVGISPNQESITRLIGAALMDANDEWQLRRRSMQIEGMAELAAPPAEEQPLLTTPNAA